MNDEDVKLFRQAEGLTYSGQTYAAYEMFSGLRERYPEQIEVLFWIVETTPNPVEARQTLDFIKQLQPGHPLIPRMETLHERRMQMGYMITTTPVTPTLRCPYCGTVAPGIVRHKTATAGWILFLVLLILFFPLCWIGFFFYEQYYVCSRCGSRIAGVN